jgi:hypothetical protein
LLGGGAGFWSGFGATAGLDAAASAALIESGTVGMAGLGMRDRMREVQKLQAGLTNPGGRLARPKGDTGKRLTADERRKLKKQREKDARRKRRSGP